MLEDILENLKKFGENICYQIKDKKYTNKELYQYVCNIYNYLIKENIDCKNVVVYGHKDIYMIATFLACSFAGFTYIPIDIGTPEERKNKIIDQVKPKIIIDKSIEKIMIMDNFEDIENIYLKPEDTYYIIFTSGSTGEPKGVKISYKNLQSCIEWLKNICQISNGVILNQANFSFDLSVADIYLSLVTRSSHYILEKEIQEDYKKLFEEVKKSKANFAVMTPSFANLLLLDRSFNHENVPYLKQILFCGEKLSINTVKKLKERFPDIDLINCYGPTECTFAVTSIYVDENINNIPIGRSKEDSPVYIINENKEILTDGEIGEILVTGASVGQGYLQDVPNDGYITFNNENAYLTGDYGYIDNGIIFYVGRKDSQIKYGGYRIELSEIENAIDNLEYVKDVVVSTVKSTDGNVKKIVAFVQLENFFEKNVEELKNDLEKNLPNYMIPMIKIINEIPINANGKKDIKKLMEEYF